MIRGFDINGRFRFIETYPNNTLGDIVGDIVGVQVYMETGKVDCDKEDRPVNIRDFYALKGKRVKLTMEVIDE